jgi:hypothetical protein
MHNGDFETIFRNFVQNFGGTILPEGQAETADFLFPNDNVVAELKTLEVDARSDHGTRLQGLMDDWSRRGLVRIYGRTTISMQKLNPACQREWLHILQPPVERIIRKANRQIRTTKHPLP